MLSQIYKLHPKHNVADDCSIFGFEVGELKLLLYPHEIEPEKGKCSLMGDSLACFVPVKTLFS